MLISLKCLRIQRKKFDLVFTFACLLHVKPEDLDENIKAIKKLGKRAIFVEPINEADVQGKDRYIHPLIIQRQKADPSFVFNVKYTFIHDYLNKFKVIEAVKLSNNRMLFVVDLTK